MHKNKTLQVNKIVASILLSLVVWPAGAQVAPDAPQLVVGITIDQLRSDYLIALQQLFGEKGFKRAMQEGVVCENVVYDFPHLDRAVSTAAIHSGTIPFYNGIVSEDVYDVTSRKTRNILHDPQFMGNATQDTYSTKSLLVSTLSDEVKIVGNGLGRVYSVAPDATTAMLAGGHIANSALWIDDKTGRWVTTTYYFDAPAYIVHPYYENTPAQSVDTTSWRPLYATEQYTAMPYQVPTHDFCHSFSPRDINRFRQYKTTPLANHEVTDVSIDLIEKASLGQRGQLDMINIGYTLAPFDNGTVQEYGHELQDAYVRLDKELSRLFEAIDKRVGLNKSVIFITSTGYFTGEGREPSFYKIQSGEFYPKRAVSLLNMYLMALYGNGEWVNGFHNNQIYLNRELIKDRALDLEEVRDKSAQFLIDMEGVRDVYTQQRILLRSTNEHTDRLRRGISSKLSGDIFIELVPGWELVYQNESDTRVYVRHNAVSAPFFLITPNIKATKIVEPVDVTRIAPTVARVLRIRAPNGCSARPLPLNY